MIYTLLFLPEVEDDAINGFSWYETKSPGLGVEFLRMFYACSGDIPRHPLLYHKVHNEFRRCLLRRFPYAIYFVIKDDQVIVTGLFHCARDPRAVGSMLQSR
jgi:toxin ParE1/3/4